MLSLLVLGSLLLTTISSATSTSPYLSREDVASSSSTLTPTPTATSTTEPPISSETMLISTTLLPQQQPQPQPIPIKEDDNLLPLGELENALSRRTVTYDQRQEGQYNIRADLENFMIVLIPPGPQEGLSLLDLLTKSASHASKSKRKHFASRHGLKGSPIKSFYQQQQQQQQRLQQQQAERARGYGQTPQLAIMGTAGESQQAPMVSLPEFIEGRTPYHVDISASDDERQQVEVLPPPYFPQLIKPFHLDAEPTLIQALPPAEATSTAGSAAAPPASSLLEGYQQQPGAHYYRNSRALLGNSYLDTNRLSSEERPQLKKRRQELTIAVPLYRADLNAEANALYPPIDVPTYFQDRNWQLDEEPTPTQPKRFTFDLLADASHSQASPSSHEALIRELARCAPGQRRDSYGDCRQIEGY
ncbi:uncharacterized protein LOC115626078 [Scaptodrosophila lebanonensis]|uniref:Uncharacterized protein LOC115626078 n=1 Tax=Drosophila lebanonensis TaxID=7225 RepID=A0A6J2TKP3_DROLE|nr:uncharacterized protein LOC115626078 [Scaptodrosophila lebanonensis]